MSIAKDEPRISKEFTINLWGKTAVLSLNGTPCYRRISLNLTWFWRTKKKKEWRT